MAVPQIAGNSWPIMAKTHPVLGGFGREGSVRNRWESENTGEVSREILPLPRLSSIEECSRLYWIV